MREIRDKKAMVTGVASGIGRAIAIQLAREGAALFLVDIDEAGLSDTVLACRSFGVEVIGRRCDVSRASEVSATVQAVLDQWSGIDILVNNAGITYYGRLHEMSDEHFLRVLRINLHAPIQFTRELLPSLLARREAHVVNVCSIFGLVGMPKLNAYCVSKFGLVGFSESLRTEYGREGLGVTAMCPGFVDTNLFTNAPLGRDSQQHKVPPRVLRTTAEKVARATVASIRRDRRLVIGEPFAQLLFNIKRFLPAVMDRFLHIGRGRRIEKKMGRLQEATNCQATNSLPAACESVIPADSNLDQTTPRAA